MTRRLLVLCLRAYPRSRRQRDGGYLLDLALELADESGIRRQAVSLVRGGWAERLRGVRRGPVLLAGGVAAAVLAVGGVAVADEGSVEVEVQLCAGADCASAEDWAADRSEGWRCDRTSLGDVSWQCTRP
jgi:hypothetical protein